MAEFKVDLPKDIQDIIGGFLKLSVEDIKEHTKDFFDGRQYLNRDWNENKGIYFQLTEDAHNWNKRHTKDNQMCDLRRGVDHEIRKCIEWYIEVVPKIEYSINMITSEIADEYSLYCYAVQFIKLSEFVYKNINYNPRYGNMKYTVPCWGA
jgi:hypothetical protein